MKGRIYTIPKGRHRARPIRFGLYFNKKRISFRVLFNTSCKYHIGTDQSDVNKLFGIGYFPDHHQDSARFGWRYNEDLNAIDILAYCYWKGIRITQHITTVKFNQWVTLTLTIHPQQYQFDVYKGYTCTTLVRYTHKRKWGYPLGLYFGGNQPAPHDITIEMKKLKATIPDL